MPVLMSIKEQALWALFRELLPFMLCFLVILFRVAHALFLALPEIREDVRTENRLLREAKELLRARNPGTK